MNITLREHAIRALAACDQIEMAIREHDEVLLEVSKKAIRQWASDLDEAKLLTWCQMVRAKAEEVLKAIGDEDCEGV
jgi:predicted secreted Zn-dependent protease